MFKWIASRQKCNNGPGDRGFLVASIKSPKQFRRATTDLSRNVACASSKTQKYVYTRGIAVLNSTYWSSRGYCNVPFCSWLVRISIQKWSLTRLYLHHGAAMAVDSMAIRSRAPTHFISLPGLLAETAEPTAGLSFIPGLWPHTFLAERRSHYTTPDHIVSGRRTIVFSAAHKRTAVGVQHPVPFGWSYQKLPKHSTDLRLYLYIHHHSSSLTRETVWSLIFSI